MKTKASSTSNRSPSALVRPESAPTGVVLAGKILLLRQRPKRRDSRLSRGSAGGLAIGRISSRS